MALTKALFSALVILLTFFLVAHVISTYVIYIWVFPIHPYAFLSPLIQGAGILLAVIVFVLLVARKRG